MTTLSSHEINQDPSGARRAAAHGPVFITDRGRPTHVLLTYEAFLALSGQRRSLLDLVSQGEDGGITFDSPRMGDDISRPADLD